MKPNSLLSEINSSVPMDSVKEIISILRNNYIKDNSEKEIKRRKLGHYFSEKKILLKKW